MALSTAQKGVLRGMAFASVMTLGLFFAVVLIEPPFPPVPASTDAGKLASVLAWDIIVLAVVVVQVGAIARHRFFTPADINGGGLTVGTTKARTMQSVLQKSVEQAFLAIGAHLVWAVSAPDKWRAWLPVAVALFVVGRVLFWRGYSKGAAARAFGFALTFYPTVLTLAAAGVMQLMPI